MFYVALGIIRQNFRRQHALLLPAASMEGMDILQFHAVAPEGPLHIHRVRTCADDDRSNSLRTDSGVQRYSPLHEAVDLGH
jgi:hypothetical protein